MEPQARPLAVNDVTTFDHRDLLGWQSIHQDRPIGVVKGCALCCGEQLHWHRTRLHERLKVPTLGSQESGDLMPAASTRLVAATGDLAQLLDGLVTLRARRGTAWPSARETIWQSARPGSHLGASRR